MIFTKDLVSDVYINILLYLRMRNEMWSRTQASTAGDQCRAATTVDGIE